LSNVIINRIHDPLVNQHIATAPCFVAWIKIIWYFEGSIYEIKFVFHAKSSSHRPRPRVVVGMVQPWSYGNGWRTVGGVNVVDVTGSLRRILWCSTNHGGRRLEKRLQVPQQSLLLWYHHKMVKERWNANKLIIVRNLTE
jgi:hypothetical protein